MSYSEAYTPLNWHNLPTQDTALEADNLNHIEQGIKTNDTRIAEIGNKVDMDCVKKANLTDTSTIEFHVLGDTVTANVKDGSIGDDKIVPHYLSDCQTAKSDAEAAALKSEGFAVGEQNGAPVTSGSPYYENNAEFYANDAKNTAAQLLSSLGISVIGAQLVFGVEALDTFTIAVAGTQLQFGTV